MGAGTARAGRSSNPSGWYNALKESEEALRLKEKLLSDILGSSPVPLFIVGSNHRAVQWTKALENYLGPRAAFLRKPFTAGTLARTVRGARHAPPAAATGGGA